MSLSPRIGKCLLPALIFPKVSAPTLSGIQRISCIKSRAESHCSVVLFGRAGKLWVYMRPGFFSTHGKPGFTMSYAARWSHCIVSGFSWFAEAVEFRMSRRGPSSWSPGLPFRLPAESVTKNFQHLGQRQSPSHAKFHAAKRAWNLLSGRCPSKAVGARCIL